MSISSATPAIGSPTPGVPPTGASAKPVPIPKSYGIEIDGPGRSDAPAKLEGREVATFTYWGGDKADAPSVLYHATVGDAAHVGHLVQGSFEDAVAVARFESAVDDIDMPLLGSSAVLAAGKGAWHVVPLMGVKDGKSPDDDGALSYLPIDAARGSAKGPGGIWEELGYGRPGRDVPEGITGAMRVKVTPSDPDLAAIVGVERWVDLRG